MTRASGSVLVRSQRFTGGPVRRRRGARPPAGRYGLSQLELFQTSKQNIILHIRNVLAEGELVAASVVQDYLTAASNGKSYRVKTYNLDMAVGYRYVPTAARSFANGRPPSSHRTTALRPPMRDNPGHRVSISRRKAPGLPQSRGLRLGSLHGSMSLLGPCRVPGATPAPDTFLCGTVLFGDRGSQIVESGSLVTDSPAAGNPASVVFFYSRAVR